MTYFAKPANGLSRLSVWAGIEGDLYRTVCSQKRGFMKCSRCGSENLSIERRIDGIRTCNDCGYKERNVSQGVHVVASIHEQRAYNRCLCSVCGKISTCTPSNDFYSTPDHGEGLVCERCFHEYLGHKLKIS